jgi:hypothetical protein
MRTTETVATIGGDGSPTTAADSPTTDSPLGRRYTVCMFFVCVTIGGDGSPAAAAAAADSPTTDSPLGRRYLYTVCMFVCV